MKLFKTTSSIVIDLDSIVYAYKSKHWPWSGPAMPCIKIGLPIRTDPLLLIYEDYTERDQEYDNLVKALEES